jgi:hypothetical protein
LITQRSPKRNPGTPSDILDLYKLSVEMADRISARRGQANQFYLTLQSTLLGVPVIFGFVGEAGLDPLRASLIALIGGVTSIVWWLQLRSYRDLNRAKFAVINTIEATHLPIQPFADEWSSLKADPVKKWQTRYAELGSVERVVPVVFFIVNCVIGATVWM